jgi:hypothetical protein
MHDRSANPNEVTVKALSVRYGAIEHSVPPLSKYEMQALSEELARRTSVARISARGPAPPARPGPESCGTCDVRHLCDAYWKSEVIQEVRAGRFTADAELSVAARLAAGASRCRVLAGHGLARDGDLILRTSAKQQAFVDSIGEGRRLRVLDAYPQREGLAPGEADTLIAGDSTEIFVVD